MSRPTVHARAVRWSLLALLGVTVALLAGRAAAQPLATPTAQQLADRLHANGDPGVVVQIRRGEAIEAATAGTRRTPGGERVAVGDRFRVGSITKAFVATVALQLGAERRLRLGDTVEHWLPGLVPNGSRITVRNLLQHTSGIEDYLNGPTGEQVLAPYLGNPSYRWSPLRLVRLAVGQPSLFVPGARWSYSNTNYVLLGLIVQKAAGSAYGRLIEQRILQPLGLRSTSVPSDGRIAGPHARGYLLPGNTGLATKVPMDVTGLDPSYASSAGSLVSNAADLDRFFRAVVDGALLGAGQRAKMQEVRAIPGGGPAAYGLGLLRLKTPCCVAWGHNGEVPGSMANAFVSADGTRSLVVLESTSALPAVRIVKRARVLEEAIAAMLCR